MQMPHILFYKGGDCMTIRGATRADLDTIMKIYEHARAAMAVNGNPTQWGSSYPTRQMIEQDILTNRQFLMLTHGQPEATFHFSTGDDPTYAAIEGAWLNDAPYGVVHRLAAAPGAKNVAARIFDWAMERCENLRIDTHEQNAPMRHLLEKNGFAYCGTIIVEDGTPRRAYHKVKE